MRSAVKTRWPVLATVPTGVMPVFALYGSTIMADMIMLSFWVWAVALWETGLRQGSWNWLLAGALGFPPSCQENGWLPFPRGRSWTEPGDMIVTPLFTSNVTALKEPLVGFVAVVDEPVVPGVSVLNLTREASFYSDVFGPQPFVIGVMPDDPFLVQRVEDGLSLLPRWRPS